MTAGQQYVVSGSNFSEWPDEIVLTYSQGFLTLEDIPSSRLLKLVSKTDDTMVFEATADTTFATNHTFEFFGTPFDKPREFLNYETGE